MPRCSPIAPHFWPTRTRHWPLCAPPNTAVRRRFDARSAQVRSSLKIRFKNLKFENQILTIAQISRFVRHFGQRLVVAVPIQRHIQRTRRSVEQMAHRVHLLDGLLALAHPCTWPLTLDEQFNSVRNDGHKVTRR